MSELNHLRTFPSSQTRIKVCVCTLFLPTGTAVGLNLLLGWPLLPCILLTGLDVVLLLLLVPHKVNARSIR
jgi:Mn2+/Fe2+ NRAMP family transporter